MSAVGPALDHAAGGRRMMAAAAAALAGEAVVDAWPGGVTAACKAQVVTALMETMTDDVRVKPPERAAAGRALGRPSWMITPRFVLNALLGEQACGFEHHRRARRVVQRAVVDGVVVSLAM